MKHPPLLGITVALAFVASSCVTYSGVSKSSDGELYISGGTSFFIFSTPWIRRCKVDGEKLECVELTEPSKQSSGSAGSASAPASSAEPPSSSTPPAAEPEDKPASDESKK